MDKSANKTVMAMIHFHPKDNTMGNYKVKNLNGTSDNTAPSGYSSWKDYWERKSGQTANICHRLYCSSTYYIVGAHVQLVDGGNEWYIVPLCNAHNQSTDVEFYVTAPLVPVNTEKYSIKW